MVEFGDRFRQYAAVINDTQLRYAFNNLARANRWIEANIISSNMLKVLPKDKGIIALDKFVKTKLT
jgi:hypothetical protein